MEIRPFSSFSKRDIYNNCICKQEKTTATPMESDDISLSSDSNVPKTYSNRYGALFLFANTYHSWTEQKQKKMNLAKDLKTLRNFRSLILQFGVDDTAFLKGVRDIIRTDSSSTTHPYNGSTLSSCKTWEPETWNNPNKIPKRLLNRYFHSVLPEVHQQMSNGVESLDHHTNKYRRLSLHLNKLSLKKHRSKGNIFPPILHQNLNTTQSYYNNNTHTDTPTQTQAQTTVDHAKISYSNFDFSVSTRYNNKNYQNRKGHEKLISTYEQEKTKPQQLFSIDTNYNDEKEKSKTCPSTPRSSHRGPTNNVPTLNHIDVQFLQNCHNKQKSARKTTISHHRDGVNQEFVEKEEPRFAYRANALSAVKNPTHESHNPEIITKDKVITRNRNLSVCGSSLPSLFGSTSSYVSKEDANILELESPEYSPSPCSNYRSIDSGWESMDNSLELRDHVKNNSKNQGESSFENSLDHQLATVDIAEVRLDIHLPDIVSNNLETNTTNDYHKNIDELSPQLPPILDSGSIVTHSSEGIATFSDMKNNEISNTEKHTWDLCYQEATIKSIAADSSQTNLSNSKDDNTQHLIYTRDETSPNRDRKDERQRERSILETVSQTALEKTDAIDFIEEDIGHSHSSFLPEIFNDVKVHLKGDTDTLKLSSGRIEKKKNDIQSNEERSLDNDTNPQDQAEVNEFDDQKLIVHNLPELDMAPNKPVGSKTITAAYTANNKNTTKNDKNNKIKSTKQMKKKWKKKTTKAQMKTKQLPKDLDINDMLIEKQTDFQSTNKNKNNTKHKVTKNKKHSLTKLSVQPIDTMGPFRNVQLEQNLLVEDDSVFKMPNTELTSHVSNTERFESQNNDFDKENIPLFSKDEKAFNNVREQLSNLPLDGSDDTKDVQAATNDESRNIQRIRDNRNSDLERRKNAALERRAKIEAKRLEQEEFKMLAIEEEKRRELLEEDLRRESEERAAAKRKMLEEQEFLKRREEFNREQAEMKRRMAEEKNRAEKERLIQRMSLLLAEREAELQLKLAKEKLESEIEEALLKKEQEILSAMEESERLRYLAEQEALEHERLREEEQKRKKLELQRISEENERQLKIEELERLHNKMLSQKYINTSFQRSKELLKRSQKISRAFAYSYFHRLPFFVPSSKSGETSRQNSGNRVYALPSLTELMDEIENMDNDG